MNRFLRSIRHYVSAKEVRYLGRFNTTSHSGVKPQNPYFWGVNRRFQAKLAANILLNLAYCQTIASIPIFYQILHKHKDHKIFFVDDP